jgi:hypothetical protein
MILEWARRQQGCRRASLDSAEPETVQSILRHAKIRATLDLYTQEDCNETRGAQGEFLTRCGYECNSVLAFSRLSCGLKFSVPIIPICFGMNGGDDETRTRDLCRDRATLYGFTTTYNNAGTAKIPVSRTRHHLLWVGLWVGKSAHEAPALSRSGDSLTISYQTGGPCPTCSCECPTASQCHATEAS